MGSGELVFVRPQHHRVALVAADGHDDRARHQLPDLPNGVDPAPTIPQTLLAETHGLVPGQYLMFAAGRMDPTKGLHHLLDAYDKLADQAVDAAQELPHEA